MCDNETLPECPNCMTQDVIKNGRGNKRKTDGIAPRVYICRVCNYSFTHPYDLFKGYYKIKGKRYTAEERLKIRRLRWREKHAKK